MINKLFTLRSALAAFCLFALSYAFAYAGVTDSPTPGPVEKKYGLSPQQALQKVEKVIIEAFGLELKKYSTPEQQKKLLNAPVDKRRHMLSFAAFNSMGGIARWAVEKGADIDKGDADNATMLKMSVINKNMEMVELALTLKANPDLLSGEATAMTLLSSVPSWPAIDDEKVVTIIGLAERFKARVSSEQERAGLLQRLKDAATRVKIHHYKSLKKYLENTGLHPTVRSVKGDSLPNNTIHKTTDTKLAEAIRSGKLSGDVLKSFKSFDKNFLHFEIFNGFEDALQAYFESYRKIFSEPLKTQLAEWDNSGNNALFAALKSKNQRITELVLTHYAGNINEAAADRKDFYAYNRKARPLGIAILWGVSDDILRLLLDYNADPYLDVGSYPQTRGHLKPGRTAFDLIDEKVELGFCTKQRAEEMKKVLRGCNKKNSH